MQERFDLRPRWQRIAVALAGPIMNILTALAIPLSAGLIYGIPSTPTPVVSSVAAGGAAEIAGLRPGDRIVSFNGNPNPDWDTISGDALLSPNEPLPMVIDIVLMNEGRIVQKGSVTDLREKPAEPFVLEFINAQRGVVLT